MACEDDVSIGADRIEVKDERCRASLSPSMRPLPPSADDDEDDADATWLRRVRATKRRMAGASAGSARNAAMTTLRSASARQPSDDQRSSSSAVRCMGGHEPAEVDEEEPPRYSEVRVNICACAMTTMK